ncbi:metallophosphoesterase family protein [Pseudogracilibacillus sp. SO30301A]|uniref:metallophosphoesterase family protein n=1 Tax=Pseudogracilibacillus sp. SO30301A TaxID=3098291 RepID=UPI00300E5270
MKIIVTSDTHLRGKIRVLPKELLSACEQADLIIHGGDWSENFVYKTLASFADVIGVHGNVDSDEVKKQFPERQLIEVKGFKIGVTHGHGEKKTSEKRALEVFETDDVDIIIFGHSHIPMMRYVGKVLLLNPGSPTYKRKLPYFSFAMLEIKENRLYSQFVFFP